MCKGVNGVNGESEIDFDRDGLGVSVMHRMREMVSAMDNQMRTMTRERV